jgi:hypothetical protein
MIKEFKPITHEINSLVETWEVKLLKLSTGVITERRNSQNRTIKQILGHMIDSASNNTHRIVHLQYRNTPVEFPNYASNGNNDRWIAIQNYQDENWENLVKFWKYSNWHLVHVIENIKVEKLENEWIASATDKVSLKVMVIDYLRHFELHLKEINDLINQGSI